MDKISGLSDELLIKILLLVPTKVAVSTSILSKRWEFLWMWLPKLEYYCHRSSSSSECESLQCFLVKNLPLHRAPVLESFRLDIDSGNFKPENIKLWVVLAISHCVRELEINLYTCNLYYSYRGKADILPSNLYTCKSLVTLKLAGPILLDVPRMVFLPFLKTLKLRDVIYLNEESLQRLLSNCPVLEDLLVYLFRDGVMRKLTVVVPSLQSLTLGVSQLHPIDGIVIQTPSLKYLKLKHYSNMSYYCLVENMPNLIEAHLELPAINSFFGSITSVKRLIICSEAIYDEGFVFNQLEHLNLCRGPQNMSHLLRLLKDSSNLQVLEISGMWDHGHNEDLDYWNQPSTVPECLLSSLQTFNWSGYTGTPAEKDFAVYILKNAVHLKTARIEYSIGEFSKFEMIKELALSSRASTTCQLMFDSL